MASVRIVSEKELTQLRQLLNGDVIIFVTEQELQEYALENAVSLDAVKSMLYEVADNYPTYEWEPDAYVDIANSQEHSLFRELDDAFSKFEDFLGQDE